LSSLEIGDVRVEHVPVYIRRFYDDKATVDGYLGLSIISKFITAIDYGERTFSLVRRSGDDHNNELWRTLYKSAPPQDKETETLAADTVEIPLRTTTSGFLSGEVKISGMDRTQNFIIDTGASISVVSEKLASEEVMASYVQPTRLRVFGAAGVADDVK